MKHKNTLYLLTPKLVLEEQYQSGLCKIGITSKSGAEERFSWSSTRGYNQFHLRFKHELFSKLIERKLKDYFREDKIKHYPAILYAHERWINTFGGQEEWFVESPFLLIDSNEAFKFKVCEILGIPIVNMTKMIIQEKR